MGANLHFSLYLNAPMLLLLYIGHKSHPDTEWEQISEVVTMS